MANAQHSNISADTATNPEQPERELHIEIWPRHSTSFYGSRAQLEAEEFIPDGTEWPCGQGSASWQAGAFTCSLHRVRPPNTKGPMRVWVAGDYWDLTRKLTNGPSYGAIRIQEKAAELAEVLSFQDPKECWRRSVRWGQFVKSKKDTRFQAFKALVPGLIPPKRGRKAAPAA